MPKNVVEKHWSLQIHFYTAQALYLFFFNKHYGCIQKSQMHKNRGQAISSCDFGQIRPTLMNSVAALPRLGHHLASGHHGHAVLQTRNTHRELQSVGSVIDGNRNTFQACTSWNTYRKRTRYRGGTIPHIVNELDCKGDT